MTPKAGIGLACKPGDVLSIIISDDVLWPEGDDYSASIIEEISAVIHEFISEPFGAEIRITEIEFCEIGSSEHAFRIAAREATKSIISVGSLIELRS